MYEGNRREKIISIEKFYEEFENRKVYVILKGEEDSKLKFKILDILGRGTNGYVFLGLHKNELVAIRMTTENNIPNRMFTSVKEQNKSDYEKYFLKNLIEKLQVIEEGLNIKGIYTGNPDNHDFVDFSENNVFITVWEHAECNLKSRLEESFENKFRWLSSLIRGVELIHKRGRVHLDIKLENLLLVRDELKIADFEFYQKNDKFQKSTILYCGTPGYIAPEMFYNRSKVSIKSDIFSAGASFAELLSGLKPQGAKRDPDGRIILSPEENEEFQKEYLGKQRKNLSLRGEDLFKFNFLIYNAHKKGLISKLNNKGISKNESRVYKLILKMLEPDVEKRLNVEELLNQLKKIEEKKNSQDTDPSIDSSIENQYANADTKKEEDMSQQKKVEEDKNSMFIKRFWKKIKQISS